jgi:hypothetical protein
MLEEAGSASLRGLRTMLKGDLKVDVRKRVQGVLKKVAEPAASPEQLRRLHGIEVLEALDG